MPKTAEIVFLASTIPFIPRTAAAADTYDEAMSRSAAHERARAFEAAARDLESAARDYPQDYFIALRMGWLYLRADNDKDALRAYRMAAERSPSAAEARAGIEACEKRELHVVPTAGISAYFYPNHPVRQYGGSLLGSLDIVHDRAGWTAGGAYRYTWGWQRSNATPTTWEQHEAHADVGYVTKSAGAILQYAIVHDLSGFSGTSHHPGLALRWSPFGVVTLDTSMSFYRDMRIFRAAPSWKIPVAWGLSIEPGAAMQIEDGRAWTSGQLAIALDRTWGSLQLGGKYGDEIRPAYLSARIVANIPERIEWGMWAAGSWNAGYGLRVSISYAMNRLDHAFGGGSPLAATDFPRSDLLLALPGSSRSGSSDAHFVTLSISKSF